MVSHLRKLILYQGPMSDLPPGWEVRYSNTYQKNYYFHVPTSKSQWDLPSNKPTDVVTRSQDEALELIRQYRDKILASDDVLATFKELARVNSDCSSAKKDGDLGPFHPGQMQRAFEEASFKLQTGQVSEPVTTDSGIHIIYRYA